MKVSVVNEPNKSETRVALSPQSAQKLSSLGAELSIPETYGEALGYSKEEFEKAKVSFVKEPDLAGSEVVCMLGVPDDPFIDKLPEKTILVSFLDPFRNPELIKKLAAKKISSLCMELIPRTTYAQKMDALSSQASLAGYAAVIIAADRIKKAFPMMSTPAGTIPPAKVFIIGAGVAGLQAIATAKRLGARVEAYDTRPVVEEQVQSLGARFVKIDVGETGQTEQGYAKALTEEQLELQRQQMAKFIAGSDIVITTAQVFGRPAPKIVSRDMVEGMRPGSVIVDLAASTGGNVEGTVADKEVMIKGVKIIGLSNFPAEVAKDASQMYANNVANLLEHAWNKETKRLELNLEDELVSAVLLTHDGEIRDERIRALVEGSHA
ncbi:MAG: NAD(P) transhydrogenase subunit alpha [Trueperaceae bacterium]|nr:NAD(P) transhydrogenase subunit alpha [Trueperaceae bacterium]